ncbi:MAG: DUF4974 domain-containing protein [Alphaproteobacteria bacterium]|nr:DUF4974 domain-containing protein [Alphaproteobacteria bacterium]
MTQDAHTAGSASDVDAPLDPLTETALEWLVTLHSGEAQPKDWADYETWRTAAPERAAAALAAERLWRSLGPAATPRKPPAGKLLALAAFAVCLAAALMSYGLFDVRSEFFADVRTAVGERQTVTLADGSRLELDTGTSVGIDLGGAERRLTLHRGRIHVAVSPDRTRPFVVAAAGGTVQALGTAFDVRRDGDVVQVVVSEHAVRVAYPDLPGGPTAEVAAGDMTRFGPDIGIEAPRLANLSRLGAWRRGLLVFDDRPLGEVAAEMARYRGGAIVIADAALRARPVTGVFDTEHADALLDALETSLPVQIYRLPWLVVIMPDTARSSR